MLQEIPFFKYQGTGNDFVMVDQRSSHWIDRSQTNLIAQICDRRFGVGADGLILLQNTAGYDFEMIYFNADGRESSMCGNGGRCIAAFAKQLGIVAQSCHFLAIDGPHEAVFSEDNWVELKMTDVQDVETGEGFFTLNTGSPHYVVFVEDLSDLDIVESGRVIRYSDPYRKDGINVNFVEKTPTGIEVATYERGVEGETLSCGTGVTAAAISYFLQSPDRPQVVPITTKGGELSVRFQPEAAGGFREIWLCGPASLVFEGTYFVR